MNDEPEPTEAERGRSPAAPAPTWFRSVASRRLGIAATCLVVIGMVGMAVYSIWRDPGTATKPADTGSSTISQAVQSPPPPQPEAKPAPAIMREQPPAAVKQEVAPQAVATTPAYVMFPAGGGSSLFDTTQPPPREERANAGLAGGVGPKEMAPHTEVVFKPSMIPGAKAGPAMRMTYMLMPQIIPCALDTAMDSTLAGSIMCHTVGQDVMSPAHIKLLPQGTLIVGSYKNDVRTGQHRLLAFAGNAFTEEGIPVPLDSGISDGLGRAGIEGDVDNRYMERFGAAIALTGVQSAMSILQAAVSKGNQTSFNFGNGSGGVESLALEILRQQSVIPPTISVPPGTVIGIVVDHPIDFSDAIKVSVR